MSTEKSEVINNFFVSNQRLSYGSVSKRLPVKIQPKAFHPSFLCNGKHSYIKQILNQETLDWNGGNIPKSVLKKRTKNVDKIMIYSIVVKRALHNLLMQRNETSCISAHWVGGDSMMRSSVATNQQPLSISFYY